MGLAGYYESSSSMRLRGRIVPEDGSAKSSRFSIDVGIALISTSFFVLADFLFKFLVIGSAGTGKSCLLHQFIENKCKF